MSARLTKLIAKYDLAEADFASASKRCYTPEFKAVLKGLPEDEARTLAEQREEEIGFNAAVQDRSDRAYAKVIAFTDRILKLKSVAPAVLALKARACLWEGTAERMREEGFVRAADFLKRLAALTDGLPPSETSRIRRAILGLPDVERDVFVLSRFGHLTYEQIGELCGGTAFEIERLIANALTRLTRAIGL